MSDIRYLHFTDVRYVKGVGLTQTFPGWIDADAFPWAKDLRLPGDCYDLFCPCHTLPEKRYERFIGDQPEREALADPSNFATGEAE